MGREALNRKMLWDRSHLEIRWREFRTPAASWVSCGTSMTNTSCRDRTMTVYQPFLKQQIRRRAVCFVHTPGAIRMRWYPLVTGNSCAKLASDQPVEHGRDTVRDVRTGGCWRLTD